MTLPTEISELLSRSGNSFHGKVATWFKNNGWAVRVSPYYVDQSQSRSREVDLIVEKAFLVPDGLGRPAGSVVARLFVECKFIPQHSVFWMADKNAEHAKDVVHSYGIFSLDNAYTKNHHYLSAARVAKVYSTAQNRESENDPYFKALNQVLNGYLNLRQQSTYFTRARDRRINEITRIDYPIIVCSSFEKIYFADFYDQQGAIPASDPFQIEVNYAYLMNGTRMEQPFLVDVVSYTHLDSICDAIKRDAELAGFFTVQ